MTKLRTFKVGVFREERKGRVDRWAAYTRDYATNWLDFYVEVEVVAESGTAAKKAAIELCKLDLVDESASSRRRSRRGDGQETPHDQG